MTDSNENERNWWVWANQHFSLPLVVGVLLFQYAEISKEQERQATTQRENAARRARDEEAAKNLEIEIRRRLRLFYTKVYFATQAENLKINEKSGKTSDEEVDDINGKLYEHLYDEMENPKENAFPEYKGRGMFSLFTNLSQVRGPLDSYYLDMLEAARECERIEFLMRRFELCHVVSHMAYRLNNVMAILQSGKISHWVEIDQTATPPMPLLYVPAQSDVEQPIFRSLPAPSPE